MNPYWDKNFIEFFGLLFARLFQWVQGDLPLQQLASDEIQLLVLMGVAISSALVGTFLVLRKMTMVANSLSHTILVGIVLAYLISFKQLNDSHLIDIKILLLASLITGIVTTLLTQLLTEVLKLQEDASIGLVFTTLFALGVVLVTLFTRNTHIGTEAIMGNVDALHVDDLKQISFVVLFNLLLIVLFFKEFKLTTFDPGHANSLGISSSFFGYLLMVQTAATAIGSFRAVGVLLVLSFLVGPPLAAKLLTQHLGRLILIACLIGSLCSLFAVAISRHLLTVYQSPLSTAGLVVSLIAAAYLITLLAVKIASHQHEKELNWEQNRVKSIKKVL